MKNLEEFKKLLELQANTLFTEKEKAVLIKALNPQIEMFRELQSILGDNSSKHFYDFDSTIKNKLSKEEHQIYTVAELFRLQVVFEIYARDVIASVKAIVINAERTEVYQFLNSLLLKLDDWVKRGLRI